MRGVSVLKFYTNRRKMKVRSAKALSYGVTSELQGKWTSVCTAGLTESDGTLQCALQSSARILALPLAHYVIFSVLPKETELSLLPYKIDLAVSVLSTHYRHFTLRII